MDEASDQMKQLGRMAGLTLVEGDGMPIVRIEKDLNQTARMLGAVISRLDLFEMNGELVYFNHLGEMKPMTGRKFCTWINDHVVMAEKFDAKSGVAVAGMLGIDAAWVVLDNENFRRGVRPLLAVNHVRLPVLRTTAEGVKVEKLPWKYDAEYQTYTVEGGLDYDEDMDLAAAKVWLERMFGTFPFSDERSKAVQVAAMLALFVKHLPGGTGLRPGFLWLANKPESGKSVLAKASLYAVLGRAAAAKLKKGDELDKELEAFSRANVPYIFLDNVYGGIQSSTIDQMLTSEESTGRAMGGHGVFTAKNTALLLVTGNRLELNEDAARRFLVVDLFEKGDPCDRPVKEADLLNDGAMKAPAWRKRVLSALWALVANWHEMGRPRGGVILGSFEDYSRLLGGVVEAAGYVSPFTKAEIPDAISPEKAEFVELMGLVLEDMGEETTKDYTLEALAMLARSAQLFQKQVGTQAEGKKLTIKEDGLGAAEKALAQDKGILTESQRSSWGKRMKKEVGAHPKVNGRKLEFGRREQSRKSTYTVTVLGEV
jgi:hypothetical protein